MSESKPKTAVDAARAVSQALKKSLEQVRDNVKHTPEEAALRVRGELRKHIIEMGNYLADLQKKEGNLNKADLVKATKKAEGSYSFSRSSSEGSASVSVSDGEVRARLAAKKAELSAEVSHAEASQPESSADEHSQPADSKKKKVGAFVPGPGKMAKDETKAFVPAPGKMVKAVAGMEGDALTSPLAKKNRTVFDILGKANNMMAPAAPKAPAMPKMGMGKSTADELKERSSTVSGTVLPSDKDQKRADAEKTGSGGKVSKGPSLKGKGEKVGEGATWKATKKTEVPSLEDPNKSDDASGGTIQPEVKKVEVPAVQDPQKKDDGSGGTVKSASGVKKTEVPSLEDPNKSDDASGGTVKPGTNIKKGETFKEAKRSMSGDINKEKVEKGMMGMDKMGAAKPPFKPSFKGHKASLGVGSSTNGKGVTSTTSFDPMTQTVQRKKTMDGPPGTMAPGYTQGQNQKMPPRQQSSKMPFGKTELDKEMAKMDAHFAKSKKGKK